MVPIPKGFVLLGTATTVKSWNVTRAVLASHAIKYRAQPVKKGVEVYVHRSAVTKARKFIEQYTPRKNPRRCPVKRGPKMTSAKRRRLPKRVFGLPRQRKYPMDTQGRAKNAKARAKQELDRGKLSRAQYNQIVRKANAVLRACGIKPKKGFAKPKRNWQRRTRRNHCTHRNNPPAHFVIDPQTRKVLFVSRVGKRDWAGDAALKKASARAMQEARRLGRNIYTVVHPYVPKGFKQGTVVSPLFFHYGFVEWGPDGAVRNPLTQQEADQIRAQEHDLIASAQRRGMKGERVAAEYTRGVAHGLRAVRGGYRGHGVTYEPNPRMSRDDAGFIDWLEETLIPDLKESGYEATAESFEEGIRFARQPRKRGGMQFRDWLRETLIPDLLESGTVETAKDFGRLAGIIRRVRGRAMNNPLTKTEAGQLMFRAGHAVRGGRREAARAYMEVAEDFGPSPRRRALNNATDMPPSEWEEIATKMVHRLRRRKREKRAVDDYDIDQALRHASSMPVPGGHGRRMRMEDIRDYLIQTVCQVRPDVKSNPIVQHAGVLKEYPYSVTVRPSPGARRLRLGTTRGSHHDVSTADEVYAADVEDNPGILDVANAVMATANVFGNPSYDAIEMSLDTGNPTGRVETYHASSPREAGEQLLYTRKLEDARWKLGRTGLVVSRGNTSWVIKAKNPLPTAERKAVGREAGRLRAWSRHTGGRGAMVTGSQAFALEKLLKGGYKPPRGRFTEWYILERGQESPQLITTKKKLTRAEAREHVRKSRRVSRLPRGTQVWPAMKKWPVAFKPARKNMPVSSAWDRASASQRRAMLTIIGVEPRHASMWTRISWKNLDEPMQEKLQKYWYMVNPTANPPRKMSKKAQKKGRKVARKNPSEVAKTILQQMGGGGKLKAMIGARNLTDHGDALSFKWAARARGGSNYLKVTLDPNDTYTMEFGRVRKVKGIPTYKVLNKMSDIYNDQLIPIFEQETGLYLRFNNSGRRAARPNPLLQTVALVGNPPRRNPPGDVEIPFREGQRIPLRKAQAWVDQHGTPQLQKQFKEAVALQTEANRAPKTVIWKTIPIGDPDELEMVTALTHYGTTDETVYKPPAGSKKGDHLYRHEWGEESGKPKPVPILAAPGGKAMVSIMGKGQTIDDWMRG